MTTPWPADKVERRSVAELEPYARNARTHSEAQVAKIAAAIGEWGWTTPILVDEAGQIIAGHGRVLAAQRLGLAEVPVMVAEGWSDEQKRAYVIADNKIALDADWDLPTLRLEVEELQAAGFDLDLVGFDLSALAALETPAGAPGGAVDDGPTYSRKIEAPIYTPRGDAPPVAELFNDAKAERLKEEIRAADLPEDVAAFLEKAAERHTTFHFQRIADFYASAPAETQRLMERSALVIVDFGKAIESGWVMLNDRLAALASGDEE